MMVYMTPASAGLILLSTAQSLTIAVVDSRVYGSILPRKIDIDAARSFRIILADRTTFSGM
jgi:hypothetical protein